MQQQEDACLRSLKGHTVLRVRAHDLLPSALHPDPRLRWRPPKYIRERTEEQHRRLREKYHIISVDIPPASEYFEVSGACQSLHKGSHSLSEHENTSPHAPVSRVQENHHHTAPEAHCVSVLCLSSSGAPQLPRSRHDRDRIHRLREIPYILSPSRHTRARGASPSSL